MANDEQKDQEAKQEGYDPNVTEEDMNALGKKGLNTDAGDDRLLQDRKDRIDFTGQELDVPTGKPKSPVHHKSIKDEENSLYGQGGERNQNLEQPERANTNPDGK